MHHIVHRDIKPQHILLHLSDPSRVSLVDFGIARKLTAAEIEPIHRYNPIKSNQNVVGTLNWCSINAHLGYGLSDVLVYIGTDANVGYQTFDHTTIWNLSLTPFYTCSWATFHGVSWLDTN